MTIVVGYMPPFPPEMGIYLMVFWGATILDNFSTYRLYIDHIDMYGDQDRNYIYIFFSYMYIT